VLAGPQRAEHGNTIFDFDTRSADSGRMLKTAAASSGRNAQSAFGNNRSIDGAVRANEHLFPTDQAALQGDTAPENHVAYTLHAATDACAGTDVQFTSGYDVAGNDLSSVNLEVSVVQEALDHPRTCVCV